MRYLSAVLLFVCLQVPIGMIHAQEQPAAGENPAELIRRGSMALLEGELEKAMADFDRAIEIDPRAEPQLWQRGIALYYLGRHDEGRRQFEIHKSVNPDDFENAAWHFLCMARDPKIGVDEAKKRVMKIGANRDPALDRIYQMYLGRATPDEVLAGLTEGNPSGERLALRKFYAELYVGLYAEARDDGAQAREHILNAANQSDVEIYMHGVAVLHAKLRGWREP
jgi:lipoprotein NlpI